MDFNRRFTGGISWAEEFGRQVGRSINALEEDTSPATTDAVVSYDASDNKPKKVSIAKLVGLTYTAISADTNLTVEYDYVDTSTADRSHTLPLLSGTTAGQRIRLAAGADGVKVVKHHASDSSGAPLTVLFKKHDHVEFVSTGTAWIKANELFTGRIRIALTADELLTDTALNTIFDTANVTVDEDTTGGYDNSSNYRYDHNASWPNCMVDIMFRILANGDKVLPFYAVSGTDKVVTSTSNNDGDSIVWTYNNVPLTAGQYLSWRADNGASTRSIMGDGAKDESYITMNIVEWTL